VSAAVRRLALSPSFLLAAMVSLLNAGSSRDPRRRNGERAASNPAGMGLRRVKSEAWLKVGNTTGRRGRLATHIEVTRLSGHLRNSADRFGIVRRACALVSSISPRRGIASEPRGLPQFTSHIAGTTSKVGSLRRCFDTYVVLFYRNMHFRLPMVHVLQHPVEGIR